MQRAEILPLTGLRGCAALLVMCYHFHLYELTPPMWQAFFRHGYLCVDIFFVLSGFVMAMMYSSWRFNTRFTFLKFISRRIARIYPAYLLFTLIGFAKLLHKHGTSSHESASLLVSNLLLIQSWGVANSIVSAAWSISTEWGVYLLFPMLVVLCLRSHKAVAAGVGALSATLIALLATLPAGMIHVVRFRGPLDIVGDGGGLGPLVRCVLEFTLGLLAWRVSTSEEVQWLARHSWPGVIVLVAILALFAMPNTDVFIVLLVPFCVLALSSNDPWISRVIGSPVPHWLGEISYSVYLVHTLFPTNGVERVLLHRHIAHAEVLGLMLSISGVLVVATLTFQFVERPARNILRIFFRRISSGSIAGRLLGVSVQY